MDRHYLNTLFQPRTVTVFCRSDQIGNEAYAMTQALLTLLEQDGFKGKLITVDLQSSVNLSDLAHVHSDLALIALPPEEIEGALTIAGHMGCSGAIVLGSGVDAKTAESLNEVARHHGIYMLGPNSMGMQIPRLGLNASTFGPLITPGPIALVSQSGALTASILDWAKQNDVGFSQVVALGPNSAVDISQVLDYLATDPFTHSIVIYLEGITDARRFMSSMRQVANVKPVVVLKSGRQLAGNQAAQTHSGAIVGSDDVFDAALRRAGAVRVRSFVQLFSAAKCLASRYRPVGKRLAIITNGGGPGVLAADWTNEIGLQLGVLGQQIAKELQTKLKKSSALHGLIDLSENASPEEYVAALEAANHDPEIDGLLVLHSPKFGIDSLAIAQAVAKIKATISKPIITCWMGDATVGTARKVLAQAAIPTFRTPEAAVDAFGNIASFYQNQQLLHQTPPPLSSLAQPDIEGARLLIESVLSERRKVLTEMESKSLLSAFHIPVTQTMLARNANEAMMIANQLGYPVALKIDSPDISHKSDVNGVALNVVNSLGVRDTYKDMMASVSKELPHAHIHGITVQKMIRKSRGREIYIGVKSDDPFGPVIAFGSGGTMIELIGDHAMELPPLNQYLAKSLIQRSQVAQTLGEWRGAKEANLEALEHILLRVSEMVCELPQLKELDINPIIVDEAGAVAVDARIVIDHGQMQGESQSRRYGHLAILPYPSRYSQLWPLPDNGEFTLRPIRPDDASMLQKFVQGLSEESRFFRFVSHSRELTPAMLARMTLIDYDREMALVAVQKGEAQGNEEGAERIIGISQYVTNPDRASCEFSLVVSDALKGLGIGSRLMLSIMEAARDKGFQTIEGLVLKNNGNMLTLMRKLGFAVGNFDEDEDFKLVTYSL
jgi:acetyltransferase